AVNCQHANVELRQVAAYDRECSLEFEIDDKNLGDHRIRARGNGLLREERRRVITVRAAPLDVLVSNLQTPIAVKIDTQGAEPFVVAGGSAVLSQTSLLIIEFWPYGIHRLGGRLDRLIELLEHFDRVTVVSEETGIEPHTIERPAKLLQEF